MLRAITRSLGKCERLLMMLSVIPSLRYSVFGSELTLNRGRIAIESMALLRRPVFVFDADRDLVTGSALLSCFTSNNCHFPSTPFKA